MHVILCVCNVVLLYTDYNSLSVEHLSVSLCHKQLRNLNTQGGRVIAAAVPLSLRAHKQTHQVANSHASGPHKPLLQLAFLDVGHHYSCIHSQIT